MYCCVPQGHAVSIFMSALPLKIDIINDKQKRLLMTLSGHLVCEELIMK